MPFSLWLFLLIFFDLNFIGFLFFNFPSEFRCCTGCQRLDDFSCFEVSYFGLIVAHENQAKAIFFIGFFERENTIIARKFIFVVIVPQSYFKGRDLFLFRRCFRFLLDLRFFLLHFYWFLLFFLFYFWWLFNLFNFFHLFDCLLFDFSRFSLLSRNWRFLYSGFDDWLRLLQRNCGSFGRSCVGFLAGSRGRKLHPSNLESVYHGHPSWY